MDVKVRRRRQLHGAQNSLSIDSDLFVVDLDDYTVRKIFLSGRIYNEEIPVIIP